MSKAKEVLTAIERVVEGKFNWKPMGKMGSYSVRLRFRSEKLGEFFFDTKFVVGFGTKPGSLVLESVVGYGEKYKPISASESALLLKLQPGTEFSVAVSWIGPRGEKFVKQLPVKVSSVKKEGNSIVLNYEEG